MSTPRITIVGTGFIGGSIGLALKKAKIEAEIVGHDKENNIATRAQKRGAVDLTKWNLIDACEGAALIILAMPLAGIKQTLAAIKDYLAPGAIITDTAATKTPVMEWANELPDSVSFIGGNPVIKPGRVSGGGIENANADVLQGATYCLVSSLRAPASAIDTVANFATLIGAQPHFIDAAEHDGILAGVQHLPALLATALASGVMQNKSWRESARLAGADFRDATQLAPADEKAASDLFLAQRAELIQWTDVFIERLHALRQLLERNDAAGIEKMVEQIATERAKWLSGKLDEGAPAVEWQDVQFSPQRLFVGALADRGKKIK
ncbi:MAG: prephenate dehydrogenase/arogenate dehydrogenase family protein [Chloroflexi bacterium]|nr:prephenate dehydrogenase/arogenate dehydrogenase family protein [Chloroflexota bacterium]